MKLRYLVFFLALFVLSACAKNQTVQITEIVRVLVTATPSPTPRPTFTPTQTQTSTPTPTPTPTAPPVILSGDPRAYQRLNPEPAYGAACGFVDTLDFPLNPPNAEDTRGGLDFASFRDRYDKFHAGEDWGFNDRSNFGKPVYSIGHGQVTFAAPNGWGPDKGTVVVRHVYRDGGYILSFYGHLDPPSVTLKVGDCVLRGDKIGEIGRPRTPPHLHFEIRLHLPNSTGQGYWSNDPTLAGWLPPSQTIHEVRMNTSPGVKWTRSYKEGLTTGLGIFDEDYLMISDQKLIALNPNDGKITWGSILSDTIKKAVIDSNIPQIYFYEITGKLSAFSLPDIDTPVWEVDLDTFSNAELIALPNGGLIVTDRQQSVGINENGDQIWQVEQKSAITSWVFQDQAVIFTTSDAKSSLWSADPLEIIRWDWEITGKLTTVDDQIYLYSEEGLYSLDTKSQSVSRLLALPKGTLRSGAIAALPDGNILLYHVDQDQRLMVVDPKGAILWERSISGKIDGEIQFITQNDQVFLLSVDNPSQGLEAKLYWLDTESTNLIHIFTGGTRVRYARDTWIAPLGIDSLLVNIGSGPMAALDPLAAFETISGP